ncbi:MAG: pyrroline-5-carboxylate reductase [Fimbriimonadaceae bacterium]|nr:pyrroline-5-carboxylate reductase [Fimbriimonadaceae bacterium]
MTEPGNVAVLGVGAMGSALIRGWLDSGCLTAAQIRAYDVAAPKLVALAAELGITALDSPAAAAGADLVVVAVKPADVAAALGQAIGDGPARPLVLSIAAGVTIASLEAAAPGCAVIRVMPNTPALVGAGASAYARGQLATAAQACWAHQLLSAVGLAVEVKESLLNAVTGLSGSGPAYAFVMLEALADGGVRCGLPRDVAQALAAQTLLGAAQLVLQSGDHPAVLKDRVASPAGTTIAGLAALEQHGFRAALIEAVTAATRRAAELG